MGKPLKPFLPVCPTSQRKSHASSTLISRRFTTEIKHYDLHEKREVVSHFWLPPGPVVVGITAGASCPNNLIEETLIRLFELRGISREKLEVAA